MITFAIRSSRARLFANDTRGAALVEFAIALPIMLLFFAVIIESSRIFWSYQAAITGVRDATRYVARVVPRDYCDGGFMPPAVSDQELKKIVKFGHTGAFTDTETGPRFSSSVDVDPVTISDIDCLVSDAPIAIVTATVTISLPFGGLFALIGRNISDFTTTVSDRARVYGT